MLVDRPNDDPIFVSLKRVRPCYEELPDIISWTGHSSVKMRRKTSQTKDSSKSEKENRKTEYKGPVTKRTRKKSLRTNFEVKEGEVERPFSL